MGPKVPVDFITLSDFENLPGSKHWSKLHKNDICSAQVGPYVTNTDGRIEKRKQS